MKIDIYSDIACPWCYIGKRRFERALAAHPRGAEFDVTYHPYQLVPDAPTEPSSHRAWLADRYGPQSRAMDDHVTALGATEGITYDFDAALHVNTVHGHRLLWLAALDYDLATQHALKEKLLAAHFTDGADVADFATLTELAVSVGMDRDRVVAFLPSGEGAAEVEADIAHARSLGISSVPTFVFDDSWAVQGAQETSTFLKALEQSAKAAPAQNAEDTPAEPTGTCTDEACAAPR